MCLLRERLSDFRKNNLQTVQEWTKSYIELIALHVHPKNSNHLRSHSGAIMALDHSRLGLENKFLENKSGRIFWVRQVYKFLPINLGACKPIFYFLYTTSEEKEYYEALFLSYRPRTKCSISQFFKTNCIHSIFRTVRSTRGLLAKPFKKFPKSPIRPAGSHFWQAPNFQWTLKELRFNIIKNLLFIFFI